MKHALGLLLPLLLAASPAAAQPAEVTEESGPVTRQTASRESPLLKFEYSWPEAISSHGQLVQRLRDDLAKSYDEALDNARENKQQMEKFGGPFHQNSFTRVWSLEGETERLYSLMSNTSTYTGGAHPNHNSSALLWDRHPDREIELTGIFTSAAGFESLIRPHFCKLLDVERAKRRDGEVLEGEFSECPAFSELTIVPADSKGSGQFDSVQLIADPYVAGPYAEGAYEVAVPVSAALVAGLKPEYRSGFESQPPQ